MLIILFLMIWNAPFVLQIWGIVYLNHVSICVVAIHAFNNLKKKNAQSVKHQLMNMSKYLLHDLLILYIYLLGILLVYFN